MVTASKRNSLLRIPSQAEFDAFDGAHCKNLYRALPPGWACPGCGRPQFEILRWTVLYPKLPSRHEGWAAGLHRHHDHANDAHRYGQSSARVAIRLPDCVICEQCNSADGTAKRKLSLPPSFSFSPSENRRFVSPTAHGFHEIDYSAARAIFNAVSGFPPSGP
jgi:hypothetical protein